MRKSAFILALLLLSCIAVGSLPQAAAAASRINMATSFGHEHPVMVKVLIPWANELKRKSSGQLDIHFVSPGVLVPAREHFHALRAGQLGAAHSPVGNNPGRLPVTGLMDLPAGFTDCVTASQAFWQLYTQSPEMQAEFDGIKVLALHASAPYQIGLLKNQAVSLADLKGRKILTAHGGESSRLLRSLGANPLMTPAQDFYFSLSRNMAEGCFTPLPELYAAKLQDSITSISLCDLKMDCYWLGINLAQYDSLTPATQKALNDASGLKLSLAIANVINDMNSAAKAALIKEEKTVVELHNAERARWLAQAQPSLRTNWLNQLKRRQVGNGEKVWERAQNIFASLQEAPEAEPKVQSHTDAQSPQAAAAE